MRSDGCGTRGRDDDLQLSEEMVDWFGKQRVQGDMISRRDF